ncbi:MAG TPA: hypothetical protein PLM53_17160 [Spirochaetota bacterium]|nr:hypothetical protein [Spirochaetota bacterium]HPC42990.1 hypothetical protein [Spirochaetota bacterium]HPL18701.1 hypothetical protein [Spirochaetota bacterium]HQF10089.1 hypothetical protein [Spirochaetota bacterium]HQH98829.1 hypothetical protein [Spirochaetota bacterium]
MKIRRLARMAVFLAVVLGAVSCSMEGTFGFKKFGQDTYHKFEGTPEFASDEPVGWAFVFKKKYGERVIGIVYQKKELVWVEVFTRSARIDNFNKVVYGTIKDLEPGQYRIVITELEKDNKLIDSKDFIIYEKETDEE